MPQSTDELRKIMVDRFGSIMTTGPEQFLESRGYVLSPGWTWSKPGFTRRADIPQDEWQCLVFLVEEWDYGLFNE